MGDLERKIRHLKRKIEKQDAEIIFLRSYIEELEGSVKAQAKEIETLSPIELQHYCGLNPEKCSNDDLWKELTRKNFEDIYVLLRHDDFLDQEKEKRDKRVFLPWKTLYTELLTLSTMPEALLLLEHLMNEDWHGNLKYSASAPAKEVLLNFQGLLVALSEHYSVIFVILLESDASVAEKMEPRRERLKEIAERYIGYEIDTFPDYFRQKYIKMFSSWDERSSKSRFGHLLSTAANLGDVSAVKDFLPFADPNEEGAIALQFAAAFPSKKAVELILADPRLKPKYRENALSSAISGCFSEGYTEKHEDLLFMLLAWRDTAGEHIDRTKPLYNAILYKNQEALSALLSDPHTDPREDDQIYIAALQGEDQGIINQLLQWEGPNGEKIQ